jgi:hypothetical protein
MGAGVGAGFVVSGMCRIIHTFRWGEGARATRFGRRPGGRDSRLDSLT